MEAEDAKRLCENTNRALNEWVRAAQKFFQTRPRASESFKKGFRMIKGEEIIVGVDLDYTETIKDIKCEVTYGRDSVKKYAEGFITVRSASVIGRF